MKTKRLIPLAVLAALAASGCGNDGGGAATVTQQAAREIAVNTADDAFPIEINDLPLSNADSKDTTEPKPVY